MKKLFLFIVTSLLFSGLFVSKTNAANIVAADLTYKNTSGLTYQVTLTVYYECEANLAPINSYQIDYQAPSTGVQTVLVATKVRSQIVSACGNTKTICEGGTGLGFTKVEYVGNVTLPEKAKDWLFAWTFGPRSKNITNLNQPETRNIYVEAKLDNLNFTGNNSPLFPNSPVAFLTLNQSQTFNGGTTEGDGDSLVYSLVSPMDIKGKPVVYNSPFTYLQPLSSVPAASINAKTGEITVQPTKANERTVLAVLVQEYRKGTLVGSTVRDLQLTVQDGVNTSSVLTGFNLGNSFDTTVVAGKQLCFNVKASDVEVLQQLTLSASDMPAGATFSPGATSTKPIGRFCWTPTDANEGVKTVTISVADDACPRLTTEKKYNITVKKSAGPGCNIFPSFSYDFACAGTNTIFTDQSFSTPGVINSWKWDFGNGETSTAKQPDTKVYFTKEGSYDVKLTVTDNNKCTETITRTIKVCAPPTPAFDIQSYDRIDETKPIVKYCDQQQKMDLIDKSTSNCNIIKREWYLDGVLIGSTSDKVFTYRPTVNGAGIKFTLKVFSEGNCAASTDKIIKIEAGPQLSTISTYSYKCDNLDTLATITASGGTPIEPNSTYNYFWSTSDAGVSITPNNTQKSVTIAYPGVGTSQVIAYAIDANLCGIDKTISFISPIEVTYTKSNYCVESDDIKFVSTLTGGTKTGESMWGVKSYAWDFDDKTTASIANPSHFYAAQGVYKTKLVVTDNTGCVRDASATVFAVLPNMRFTVSDDTVCYNSSKIDYSGPFFEVSGGTISHSWKLKNSLIGTAATGTIIPNFEGNGDLKLDITYNGTCTKSFDQSLYVHPRATIKQDKVLKICYPDVTEIYYSQENGDAPIKSYLWDFYFKGVKKYTTTDKIPMHSFFDNGQHAAIITLTDENNCVNTMRIDSVFFREKVAKPLYKISGYCVNEDLLFSQISNPAAGDFYADIFNYDWYFDLDNSPGKIIKGRNPFYVYTDSGQYTTRVIATTINGCSNSADSIVKIFPQPVASYTSDITCFGLQNTFLGDSIPSKGNGDYVKGFVWIFDNKNGVVDTVKTRNAFYTFKNYSQPGVDITASFVSINSYGCADTATNVITVYPKPTAGFYYNFEESAAFKEMTFFGQYDASHADSTSSSDVIKWKYDFGNGQSKTENFGNVPYTYPQISKYNVQLIVENQYGCLDTIAKRLDLNSYVIVPNALTPNDDNHGDYFEIVTKGVTKLNEYKVYNRWGEVVFDGGNNLGAKWDGKFNSQEQPMGVYVYYISATTVYGEEIVQKGNLTLIR